MMCFITLWLCSLLFLSQVSYLIPSLSVADMTGGELWIDALGDYVIV